MWLHAVHRKEANVTELTPLGQSIASEYERENKYLKRLLRDDAKAQRAEFAKVFAVEFCRKHIPKGTACELALQWADALIAELDK